jgi:hypothetical protein
MKAINALQKFLFQEAKNAGLTIKEFDLDGAVNSSSERSQSSPENLDIQAFIAGLHPVILAEFGGDLTNAPQDWATAQKRAAIARTSVATDSGVDLVLIMVGQPGSCDDKEWCALAMEVERNDLVCRKLVWLPPEDAADTDASLQDFLRRTFFAKPWDSDEDIEQTRLDALTDHHAALAGWEDILDRQPLNRADVDYDALVEELIKAHQK